MDGSLTLVEGNGPPAREDGAPRDATNVEVWRTEAAEFATAVRQWYAFNGWSSYGALDGPLAR